MSEQARSLIDNRCSLLPGDLIQPMCSETKSRRTMRVLACHLSTCGYPFYTAIDKSGRARVVSVSDDPRPGFMSDSEEE